MGGYCSMAFVLFFTSVVLAAEIGDQCQTALMTRCFKVYREDLKDTSESLASHCFRLQKLVTCFADEPKCGGELIEKFRYMLLQTAIMDETLGTCQDVDYTALKSIVQESDVAKTRGFLDDVEYDSSDACALTVHKKCVRYYLSLMIKDHKMCEDLDKWEKCYDLYSSSIGCKSKIIQRYASMVDDVAERVVQLVQNHMKSLCESAAEL